MLVGQGWKPDGFEKALLGEKAHEHTALFTRIEMDLLNSHVLRCARTLTISRAHYDQCAHTRRRVRGAGPHTNTENRIKNTDAHCSFGSESFGWNLAAGSVFCSCLLLHHLPVRC